MRIIGHRTIGSWTRTILAGCMLALASGISTQVGAASPDFVTEKTYLRTVVNGKSVRLEAFVVKRADLTGRLPVAMITHGKSASLVDMLAGRASDYAPFARDLAQRGYLSVVVLRRGFGQSDGPLPVTMTCDTKSYLPFFNADADDLQGALEVIAKRPDADPDRAIAIGESAGGAAVMALAARNPKNLRGVINVSGGLQSVDCPKEDLLVSAFREFGAASRVPTVWIYANNDSLFGQQLVERMQSAYLDGGGDVKLVMHDKYGTDGHRLFGEPTGRLKWLLEMDGFLRHHDLPTTQRDNVAELIKQLKMDPRGRSFLEQYLAAPTYKAIAITPDGKSFSTQIGAPTPEVARKAVLDYCRESYKLTEPCVLVMDNDTWVGPAAVGVQAAAAPAAGAPTSR